MVINDHIENDFCKARCIDSDLNWLVVHYFSQLCDNDQNGIIGLAFPVN